MLILIHTPQTREFAFPQAATRTLFEYKTIPLPGATIPTSTVLASSTLASSRMTRPGWSKKDLRSRPTHFKLMCQEIKEGQQPCVAEASVLQTWLFMLSEDFQPT